MRPKASIVVPCLWSPISLFDMTVESLRGLLAVDAQIVIVADKQPYTVNVNAGLKACTGDILVITNNDIEYIDPAWLDHLVKPLSDGYDIMSIRTSDSDGYTTKDHIEDNAKFGSIFAMKREVYEELGGFDEQFKGYFSDLDYYQRASVAGFKIGKNHAGLVEHKGKATYKQTDPKDTEAIEGRALFKRKWGFYF